MRSLASEAGELASEGLACTMAAASDVVDAPAASEHGDEDQESLVFCSLGVTLFVVMVAQSESLGVTLFVVMVAQSEL